MCPGLVMETCLKRLFKYHCRSRKRGNKKGKEKYSTGNLITKMGTNVLAAPAIGQGVIVLN